MNILKTKKHFSKLKEVFILKNSKISRRSIIIFSSIFVLIACIFFGAYAVKNKRTLALTSLSVIGRVSQFLPIDQDQKKQIDVVNTVVGALTQKDNKERTFMILLQNDTELRPGGGFLGQYAIVKIKNGEVISTFVEDANLLDQRIGAKIPTPFPFKKMMSLSKWKFRDSNFSPDFPTNVQKAQYFYRLSGRSSNGFDGVIAVNSQVFDDIFTLTGPIDMPGYGQYSAENASRKLEEQVEKQYLMDPALDTQNRKAVLKTLAPMMMNKLLTLGNVSKIADLFQKELKNRNVMVNFSDPALQQAIESVHWDGSIPKDWGGDYLMAVDANMGALKSDYYIKRQMSYDVDLTAEKPTVTLNIKYDHTATHGDWRTSDYHSYLRIYVPQGSTFLENHMVNHLSTADEFGKTYFGFKLDVLIGHETDAQIKYQLPDSFANMSISKYRLLIQKQSGVGEVPVTIHIKAKDGDYTQQQTLSNDLNFAYREQ